MCKVQVFFSTEIRISSISHQDKIEIEIVYVAQLLWKQHLMTIDNSDYWVFVEFKDKK